MRELRLVLLGLAAVIALLLSGTFLLRAVKGPPQAPVAAVAPEPPAEPEGAADKQTLRPPLSPALAAVRGTIERRLAETPDYMRFFDRLKLVFPTEYDTILDGLAAANSGKAAINPDTVMADAVAALRKARGNLAAKASDEALAQIFAMQAKEMHELGTRDPHLCVAFLYGANGAGFLGFAADHRALVSDAAIAGLDAMSSGQTSKIDRAAPSDSDFRTLDKALVDKGLTRPQIDALLDGKAAEPPIPDDAMCQAGQTYLQTLSGLPEDVRERLYGLAVDLMAKS